MFRALRAAVSCVAVSAVLSTAAQAQAALHPLDPLSRQEHFAVLEVLQQAGKLTDATRFTRLEVKAPDKASVWAWKPGAPTVPFSRSRHLAGPGRLRGDGGHHRQALVSWTERKGVQPMWLESEFGGEVVDKAMKDPRFAEALKKRGITNAQFVTCIAVPPGNFGEPKYAGKRIGVLSCRQRSGYRNTWARRIEGLVVVMDMHAKEILEFTDDEAGARRAGRQRLRQRRDRRPARACAAPLEVRQPAGPGYTMNGHVVSWDRWRFHVRPDSRVGVIISTATWRDGERERPVLYEGHLSEIFVPYMSPQKDWYVRTFIDAGEFSAGGLADSLSPGVDCPDYATYIDSVVPEGAGWPNDKPRVACIFERTGGDMIWRHGGEGRPQRELVVRMIAMIGNYDYVVDWRFLPDGQIKVALGATGIVETKMTAAKDARVPSTNGPSSRADAYGRFVEDHVVAVNHDHYFNFRLDMDVDGADQPRRPGRRSSPRRCRPIIRAAASGSPRPSRVDTEQAGAADDGHAQAGVVARHQPAGESRRLSDELPAAAGALDPHPARRPMKWHGSGPGSSTITCGSRRTPRRSAMPPATTRRSARRARGCPPTRRGTVRSPATDVVLWYTFGMHHMVRAEEWPVMPVLWHEFALRPFDFHDGTRRWMRVKP